MVSQRSDTDLGDSNRVRSTHAQIVIVDHAPTEAADQKSAGPRSGPWGTPK